MSAPFRVTPFRPMLAVAAEPFDAPEYVFEVKWDGVRALAAREAAGWRLWGRDLADYRARYPELEGLARLPAGTVLDGEVVLPAGGAPDLDARPDIHAQIAECGCQGNQRDHQRVGCLLGHAKGLERKAP
jgi:hypothetical protein